MKSICVCIAVSLFFTTGIFAATATQFAVVDINGGNPVPENTAFAITVQAQDANGNPSPVVSDTTIFATSPDAPQLNPKGRISGIIKSGTSSGTISGIVVGVARYLTLIAASGDVLSGPPQLFIPGVFNATPPVTFMFVIQTPSPGNAFAPFSTYVYLIDSNSNICQATRDIPIQLTLGSGTGTLSGTLSGVVPAGSFYASFNLTYSKGESGITLVASTSAGAIRSAVSPPFTIAAHPSGLSLSVYQTGILSTTVTTASPFTLTVKSVYANTIEAPVLEDTTVCHHAWHRYRASRWNNHCDYSCGQQPG